MPGLDNELVILVYDSPPFYSLYADGLYSRKAYIKEENATRLYYPPDAVLALYYTYPSFRTASLIRNTERGSAAYPSLSKRVTEIFSVRASRVDKLKRALAFIREHCGGYNAFDDGFYIRLYFIIQRQGKLDYGALKNLATQTRAAQPRINRYVYAKTTHYANANEVGAHTTH